MIWAMPPVTWSPAPVEVVQAEKATYERRQAAPLSRRSSARGALEYLRKTPRRRIPPWCRSASTLGFHLHEVEHGPGSDPGAPRCALVQPASTVHGGGPPRYSTRRWRSRTSRRSPPTRASRRSTSAATTCCRDHRAATGEVRRRMAGYIPGRPEGGDIARPQAHGCRGASSFALAKSRAPLLTAPPASEGRSGVQPSVARPLFFLL
jgi:hypothetical protein